MIAMIAMMAMSANGAARFVYFLADSSGAGQEGVDLKMYRKYDNTLHGTFTEVGNGVYYYDFSATAGHAIYLKADGVKLTETDGMIPMSSDFATYSMFSSTSISVGASLVGIYDVSAKYSSTTVEGALTELKTASELVSAGAVSGASLIGVYDGNTHYTSNTVETVLDEIGPTFYLLNGLTSTAAELNKLDGTSAYVTAANLTDLCDSTSTTLRHRHSLDQLDINGIGPRHQTADAQPTNFTVYSGYNGDYNGSGPKGNIYLNTYNADGSGRVYVRMGNDSEVQTDYEVVTAYKAGDLNWTGNPIIGGSTTITAALQRLSSAVYGAVVESGAQSVMIYSSGTSGYACSMPDTTIKWAVLTTEVLCLRQAFVCEPGMNSVTADFYVKKKTSGTGKAWLAVGGYEDTEYASGTSWTHYQLKTSLPDVTEDSLMTVNLRFKSDDADSMKIAEWIYIRASFD